MTSTSQNSAPTAKADSKILSRIGLSLRTKIIASVAILLVVISIFLLAFFPARMASVSLRGLESRVVGMSTVLASAAVPAVEFNEDSSVKEILAEMAKIDDVAYVGIRRGDGSLLASTDKTKVPDPVTGELKPTPWNDNGYLRYDVPIKPRVGEPGMLTVGFKLDQLNRERNNQIKIVALVSALVLLLGAGISFWMGTFLVRPIQRDHAHGRLQPADPDRGQRRGRHARRDLPPDDGEAQDRPDDDR